MLYYVPLESYKERYTLQCSAPKTGWYERNWIKVGIPYTRIEGETSTEQRIKTGSVLDAVGRSIYSFSQIKQLLLLAERGEITNNDVIFFDDFWTPGIEALAYAFHLLEIQPRMYAFLYAQSVDEFDFTHPMRSWMRPIERGYGTILSGIFVCSSMLRDLVVLGGIAPYEKIHVVGLPFSSEEVRNRMPISHLPKQNRVVFSSRWDKEKNPDFFLQVALEVLKSRQDIEFVVCTGAEKIRSNNDALLHYLRYCVSEYPDNIILRENLSKEEYYIELCKSKIQMNTADQDWVSFTLLEATLAGCYPIYPYFRSFPETFEYQPGFMYERLNVEDASKFLLSVIDQEELWSEEEIQNRSWIYRRFDSSWLRMAYLMGLTKEKANDLYEE